MRKRSTALCLACLIFLSGCGDIDDVKQSTVTVNKKGVVTEVLIEDFSSEKYDGEELKKSVKELVDAYNKKTGKVQIDLKKSEVKEGTATVQLQFQTDDDYRGFNQVDFFAGTVKEAKEAGYGFTGTFVDSKGKDVLPGNVPDKCLDEKVMIIREPLAVLVPGTILYASKNMELLGKDQAKLSDDTGISYENAQVTTEAYGYVIYSAE